MTKDTKSEADIRSNGIFYLYKAVRLSQIGWLFSLSNPQTRVQGSYSRYAAGGHAVTARRPCAHILRGVVDINEKMVYNMV
jgi:hypothetical protein